MSTTPTSLSTFDQIMAEWRAMCDENRRLKGENDRLWRYLTDEVGIVTLPEWMRDRIVERIRAEEEGE